MPKCFMPGCVFGAQVKAVITAPLFIAGGTRVAPFCLVSESGVCQRCSFGKKVGDFISRDKWKEINSEIIRRGMRCDWKLTQLNFIDIGFRGVIDGRFHRAELDKYVIDVGGTAL